MNITVILGNLTRDPELKSLPSGTKISEFSIAHNEVYKDKSGNKNQKVMFLDCKAFGITAENIHKFYKKGAQILLNGRLAQDTWEDKSGNKRSKIYMKVDTFSFCGNKNTTKTETVAVVNTQLNEILGEEITTQQVENVEEDLPFLMKYEDAIINVNIRNIENKEVQQGRLFVQSKNLLYIFHNNTTILKYERINGGFWNCLNKKYIIEVENNFI